MRKGRMFTLALMLCMLFLLTGCQKEEKQFDFSKITAVEVFTAQDAESVTVNDQKKAQEMLKQIETITWEKQDEEDTSEYKDGQYRVLCFDKKGEKKQNIIICSETRILYNEQFLDAEEAQLDLSIYEDVFNK